MLQKPAPVDFSQFDAAATGEDALDLAAAAVEQAIAPFADRDPNDDLIALCREISADLKKLAAGLRQFDTESMQSANKRILDNMKRVYTLATQLYKACTDKVVAEEISVSAQASGNRSVQLKVILNVKARGHPASTTSH